MVDRVMRKVRTEVFLAASNRRALAIVPLAVLAAACKKK